MMYVAMSEWLRMDNRIDIPAGELVVRTDRSGGTRPFCAAGKLRAVSGGGIYLRRGQELVRMLEQPYGSESELQALLAAHPEMLAVEQPEEQPRRWLLLGREVPVGDGSGDSRWSVDHLFVDQDAIPTIVEVKRSEDTRIRREVAGQMLEYAANALAYWKVDELRAEFEAAARDDGQEPDRLIAELTDGREEPDEFWMRVHTNLATSKIRLIFLADEIPRELRRLVEFLNEQTTNTEVLAIELKQYVDRDGQHQTLVPRLLGQSERANQAKGSAPARRWDRDLLLRALEAGRGAAAAETARRILTWTQQQVLKAFYGRGQQTGSLTPGTTENGGCYPFTLYTYGRIEIKFQDLARRRPFDLHEMRQALQSKLNAIAGISIPDDGLDRRPSIPLTVLESEDSLRSFLETMSWVFEEVRQAWDPLHGLDITPDEIGLDVEL